MKDLSNQNHLTATSDDLRILEYHELPTPQHVIEELPINEKLIGQVTAQRQIISNILLGTDSRIFIVMGPCSIHEQTAAIEYAQKLTELAQEVQETIHLVMRVYFEKPRSTVGWKGLINDPGLDNSFQIDKGLRLARRILFDINEIGIGCATEFLDVFSPQYVADLICWGAIGARTCESQLHREMSSGLSCPVGFKNSTAGDVEVAAAAVKAASRPHHFMSITKEGKCAIASTSGNHDCHIILRGGRDGTNYDAVSVDLAAKHLRRYDIEPQLMIDCSHANSGKDYRRQPVVAQNVLDQIMAGDTRIKALMLESFLVAGRQELAPKDKMTYGQSVTDSCMDFATSRELILNIAEQLSNKKEQ